MVRALLTWSWIAEGLLALLIQTVALRYAQRTWAVAKRTQISAVVVMAHSRLRSNRVRISIIIVNLLIGVASVIQPVRGPPITVLGIAIASGFILNELAMTMIAWLEVRALRKIRGK